MRKNNKKQIRTVKHDHPGRPKYIPKFPTRKEFTFQDILDANGVETNPKSARCGKGEDCSLLTIRKNLERDMYFHKSGKPESKATRTRVNPRSLVCLIHGVTAEPNSESGLGRRALVYCLRVNKDSVTNSAPKAITPKAIVAPKATRKARTPKNTSQTPVSDALDRMHAVLAAPEVAPAALTVPAVTIAPPVPEVAPEVPSAVNTPAPVSEPIAETPALEASPVVAEASAPAPEAAPASTLVNS